MNIHIWIANSTKYLMLKNVCCAWLNPYKIFPWANDNDTFLKKICFKVKTCAFNSKFAKWNNNVFWILQELYINISGYKMLIYFYTAYDKASITIPSHFVHFSGKNFLKIFLHFYINLHIYWYIPPTQIDAHTQIYTHI